MKKTALALILVFMSITLVGCGHDHSGPVYYTTQILSDPVYDGDIDSFGTVTYALSTSDVLAGIDPATLNEYRGFLDFPLSGPGGVPGTAYIASATLDIFINNISQNGSNAIPFFIDLVYFQPPTLYSAYFSLPPLTFKTVPFYLADIGQHVTIDVTSLMIEAQRQGLPDFQVRILEDGSAAANWLIEINDSTIPPLLEVTYY